MEERSCPEEIEQQKELFRLRFAKALNEKKLMRPAIGLLGTQRQLLLLYMLGFKEAKSYQSKSREKAKVFIDTKLAKLVAKPFETDIHLNAFLFRLLREAFLVSDLNENLEKHPGGDGRKTALREKLDLYRENLNRLVDEVDLHKAYLLLACLVSDTSFDHSISDDDIEQFMESFRRLDREYMSEVILRYCTVEMDPVQAVSDEIETLKDQYDSVRQELKEVLEGMVEFKDLPSKEMMRSIKVLTSRIQSAWPRLSKIYQKKFDSEPPEPAGSMSLAHLFSVIEEIKKQPAIAHPAAFEKLDKARTIAVKGKQEAEEIRSLIKAVDELSAMARKDKTLQKSLAEGEHPIIRLLQFIEKKIIPTLEDLKNLAQELTAYVGEDCAKALANHLFWQDMGLASSDLVHTEEGSPAKDVLEGGQEETSGLEISEKPQPEPRKPEASMIETEVPGPEIPITESRPPEEVVSETPDVLPAGPDYRHLSSLAHNSQSAAASVLSEALELNPSTLEPLMWHLLREEYQSSCYHLARCASKLPEASCFPPLWLLRASILGPNVRYTESRIAKCLKEDFVLYSADIFRTGNKTWNHTIRFLLAGSAIVPSLLAPETGASEILAGLWPKEGLDSFYEYISLISEFGRKQRPLEPHRVKRVKDLSVWKKELEDLRLAAKTWLANAHAKTIIYGPAGKVWLKWLETGDFIHSLVSPVINDDVANLTRARGLLAEFGDVEKIKDRVEYTDRKVLKRGRGSANIVAKAMSQLVKHSQEALEFLNRWVVLHESPPTRGKDFIDRQLLNLGERIKELRPKVLSNLDAFEKRAPVLPIIASISVLKRAIATTQEIFDPDTAFSIVEKPFEHLLQPDLLLIPAMRLDEAWDPLNSDEFVLAGLVQVHAEAAYDWDRAYRDKCSAGDYETADRVIEFIKKSNKKDVDLTHWQTFRERTYREHREALSSQIETTRSRIDGAVALGLLTEEQQLRFSKETNLISENQQKITYFPEVMEKLQRAVNDISEIRLDQLEQVKKRMLMVGINDSHPEHGKVAELISKGDVLTANEYINLISSGQALPEPAGHDRFQSFFPARAREIETYLEKSDSPKLIRKIQRNERVPGTDVHTITGAQAHRAAEIFEAWLTVKNARKITVQQGQVILNGLGFNVIEAKLKTIGRSSWLEIRTEIIRDRNQCPVAEYGSQALGRYRVLCVWDRPSEEDILNSVGSTYQEAPVLVFYFARMTEVRRRELAKLCRERQKTFIVIDDILLFSLLGERGSWLSAMFECALPFTYLQPYAITAGLVPEEMFYGRQREKESIIRPDGSCFIYGGRQLGKTALLRDVERTVHAPEKGAIAVWIDLKAEGIGYNHTADAIWNLIGSRLRSFGVIPQGMSATANEQRLFELINSWISQDSARRVLLLLDEADKFLEIDAGEDFRRSSALKGLMDRTNRKFKVVFAGLHNVQRTTTQSNHPLAHYGQPICIGPLLGEGELREAAALVERPLNCLGYRFQSPELVFRILSQTNFYPNLIQLYCYQLLKHLFSHRFDPKETPPYIITSKNVEDAYLNQDLRKSICDRFMWTLQLDPRYTVIAYSMAFYALANETSLVEGMPLSTIRKEVLSWWSEGFKQSDSLDSFRVLLDEMVGLGITCLIEETGNYAFRSPNVRFLMGTEEDIESVLLEPREGPLEYEASYYRSGLPKDVPVRNPLTVQQEARLKRLENGVVVIMGCDAAGLGSLQRFIRHSLEDRNLHILENEVELGRFRKKLDTLVKNRKDGTTTLLVSQSCAWSTRWVEEAVARIRTLTSRTACMLVVFCADPKITWGLVEHSPDVDGLGLPGEVYTLHLEPWNDSSIRQWLNVCGFGPVDTPEGRERISLVTGGWPELLYQFYGACVNNTFFWEKCLDEMAEKWKAPEQAGTLMELHGLNSHIPRTVLGNLSSMGEATIDELAELTDDVPRDSVSRSIFWADCLRLVKLVSQGRYVLNPFVAELLKTE